MFKEYLDKYSKVQIGNVPHFKAFGMMNLQYEITICHKIHIKGTMSQWQMQVTIFLSGTDVNLAKIWFNLTAIWQNFFAIWQTLHDEIFLSIMLFDFCILMRHVIFDPLEIWLHHLWTTPVEAKGTSSSQQPLLAEVSKNELYLISWKCIRFTPFYLFSHWLYSKK